MAFETTELFDVVLPLASAPDPTARILVVDDDPELMPLIEASAMTMDARPTVDWCPTLGRAAVEMGRHRFDLVLADWRLGGGESGLELESLMTRFQPSARFAVMSAAPRSEIEAQFGEERWPFLPKPFTRIEGGAFLQDLLDHEADYHSRR